jgi:hypothetical protein
MAAPSAVVNGGLRRPDGLAVANREGLRLIEWDLGEDVHDDARSAVLRANSLSAGVRLCRAERGDLCAHHHCGLW